MRKITTRSFILTVLVLLLAIGLFKIPAMAEEIEEPYHTVTFYDKDGVTVLAGPYVFPESLDHFKFSQLYSEEYLDAYGASYHDLRKIVNGYEVTSWRIEEKKRKTEEWIFRKNMPYSDFIISTGFDLARNDYRLTAIYSSTPAKFPINYVTNGGTLPESAEKYVTATQSVVLSKPKRKACLFEGWYLDSKFNEGTKVEKIYKTVCGEMDYNDDFSIPSITVYAKWKSVKPQTPVIKRLSNSSKGKVSVTIKAPTTEPKGYELQYSTDKSFKTNLHTADLEPAVKFTAKSLAKGKTYYFRLRAYNIDSTKERTYSSFSDRKSIKITNGESEVAPKPTSAKLKDVRVSGSKTKVVNVTASVSKRVKSIDDFYYLVKVDPLTGKYHSMVAYADKASSLTIKAPLVDSKGNNLYAAKLAIAVKSSKDKYTIISSASYINNPTAGALYTKAYPVTKSKKGRQGIYSTEDGDKHYFNNFNINSIISTKAEGGEAFKYNGKTYYFKNNQGLDNTISYVNRDGGTVTLQVMLAYDSRCKNLIKASARSNTTKPYYAFNVEEASARNQIEAAFYWLAKHYSQASLHVDNWILGNEVNTFRNPIGYYWAGNVSNAQFIENYAQTFRILYYAVASNNKYARVFTSVDHTFNNRDYDWGVKNFTLDFNTAVKKLNPNIQWNLAYHAYSAVLTNADFWNDDTSNLYTTSNSYATDYVSPLNIEVLVQYVREKFGKKVHIILSEQAFSSTAGNNPPVNGGRAAGEDVQAAAVSYLFYKVMFNKDIDSVIFSHPYDNLGPGMDFSMKPQAYTAYKYMDTPSYGTYTTKCIATISRTGHTKVNSWKALIPSFDDSVLRDMPKR